MLHIKWLHLHLQICTKFKKMKEIFHKKFCQRIKSEERCCSSLCTLYLYVRRLQIPLKCVITCVLQQRRIYKAFVSFLSLSAIEMLHALRTVANPGIDALFEIGWTIKQPWKQSSCWDQSRPQLNLRGWP